MSNVPNRETFVSAYAGRAPWDIDGPQKAIIDVADRIAGSILDAGCGTGENALFFAGRGHKVTGIDFLAEPIERARRKAAERGLEATFLVMDALALKDIPEVFDTAIDSGLFHVFDDGDRRRYVEGLASALKPGGRLFLLCFSDEEPGTQGPRRVSGGRSRTPSPRAGRSSPSSHPGSRSGTDLKDIRFSEGGPKAWFSVIRRGGLTEPRGREPKRSTTPPHPPAAIPSPARPAAGPGPSVGRSPAGASRCPPGLRPRRGRGRTAPSAVRSPGTRPVASARRSS